MNKIKTMNEILGFSKDAYEEDYLERYMRWCLDNCTDPIDLQKIMANRPVNNYYSYEFLKLERKFLTSIQKIEASLNYLQKRQMYTAITSEIFLYKPKPLFQLARKTNVINKINQK